MEIKQTKLDKRIKKLKEYGFCFAFDDCHKIYIIKNLREIKKALGWGYKIYPLKELKNTYINSCPLKFISSFDLKEAFIKQNENF